MRNGSERSDGAREGGGDRVDRASRIRFLNGRFLTRPISGVERTAGRLIDAIDRRLEGSGDQWTLLCPRGVEAPALRHIGVRRLGPDGATGHAWEQMVLPWAARTGLLVNLAGAAPLLARRQLCLIHDAAVFDRPQAYTRAFATWYRFLFRRLARRAEALVTVSDFSRGRLARSLGVPESRIDVVANGGDHLLNGAADTSVLDRLGVQAGRYLLAVASPNPNKNLARLLEAFGQMPAGARLVIVGAPNRRVFAADGQAPDPPGVVRADAVSDAALKALYCGARALVFPSLYEGFGLPPAEAMSLGCPVVASDTGPMPEVCGDAALYVDPRSTSALSDAMRRVLEDDALCAMLAARGAARAGAMTWDASAARLLERIDTLD